LKIWRSSEGERFIPAGHYGGLAVADVVSKTETGAFSVQVSNCPPGGGGEMHSHDHDTQLFFIMSGELTFDVGDRQFTMGSGDAVLFMPKEQHATHNHGREVSTSLVVTVAG